MSRFLFSPPRAVVRCCAALVLGLVGLSGTLPGRGQSVVLESFEGLRGNEGFPVCAANASGAKGPRGLLQVSETTVAYRPSGDEAAGWSMSLSAQPDSGYMLFEEGFRGPRTNTSRALHPRVCYDHQSGRFFITATEITGSNSSTDHTRYDQSCKLHIAVSTNSAPGRGDWIVKSCSIRVTDGEFSNSYDDSGGMAWPVPGVDGEYLYVSGTLATMEGGRAGEFKDARELGIFAFSKAALFANALPSPRIYRSDVVTAAEPVMPAVGAPSPVDAWFASVTGNPFSPTLRLHYFDELTTNFRYDQDETDVDGSSVSDDAPQPQSPVPAGGWAEGDAAPDLVANSAALASAVRVGNFFWVTWTGDEGGRSVVRWARLHPGPAGSGATILDEEGFLDAGGDKENLRPAIGANPHGDLCMVWTTSSDTTAPAVWYSVRLLNGIWEAPHLLKQSAQPANLSLPFDAAAANWGKGTVVFDPSGNNFMVAHEFSYGGGADARSLWWAKISPCPLPVISVTTPASPAVAVKGGSLALSAAAAGPWTASRWEHDPSLETEWQGGAEVPGSVNALSFTRHGLVLEHRGKYRPVLTTGCGTLVSGPVVRVEVIGPPEVIAKPGWRFACPGDRTWFQVTVESERLDYDHLAEFPVPITAEWFRSGNPTPVTGIPILPGSALFEALTEEEQRHQSFALIFPEIARSDTGVWRARLTNAAGSTDSSVWRMDTAPRFLIPPQAPRTAQACGPPVVLTASFLGVSPRIFDSIPTENLTRRPSAFAEEMQIVWRHRGVPIVPEGRFSIVHRTEGYFDAAIQDTINMGVSTLTITDPDYMDEGDYDCVVTDACGAVHAATSPKTWLQLVPTPPWLTLTAEGPDSRDGHGVIYDEARRETVLFGGEAFGYDPRPGQPNYFGRYGANDTWTWDGNRWTKRNPEHRPPSLRDFALAYDRDRQRVVIFGGARTDASALFTNQTWEWDGVDWTQRSSATVPAPRNRHTMCYDTVRREVLMLGGDVQGGDYYLERKKLWAWNGSDWVVRNTAFMGDAFAVPYYGPAFAFDERRGVAVLYDRVQSGSSYVLPEWNGSSWQAGVLPPGGAVSAAGRGAFYDPWRRVITVTGGSAQPGSTEPTLMHYDGFSWRGETPAVLDRVTGSNLDLLNVRIDANFEAAFDRDRRAYVWFHSRNPFYNGQAFTREIRFFCKPWIAHLPTAVTVQTGQSAQFRVIAAGLPDLSWQWSKNGVPLTDGGGFLGTRSANLIVQKTTAASAGGYSVTVTNAYGSVTSAAVALTVTGPVLTDTAVPEAMPLWDPPNPHSTVPEEVGPAVPGSGNVVLDGTGAGTLPPAPVVYSWRHNGRPVSGNAASLTLTNPDYDQEGEWELFAETGGAPASRRLLKWWRVRMAGELPYVTLQHNGNIPRLTDFMMAYDSRRGVTVAYGGAAYGLNPATGQTGGFLSRQTWEWDGTGWLLRKPAGAPPPLDQAGVTFDARRGRVVLFGGRKYNGTAVGSAFEISNETWEYDGSTWTLAQPQTSPPASSGVSMCYDTVRQEVLMIGGSIAPYADRHVLWAWNGLNWTRRSAVMPYRSSGSPVEVYGQNAMAFDESRGVAVLFGSFSGSSSDYDVLEWDGAYWRAVAPEPAAAGEPQLRHTANGTAFYDPWRRMTGVVGAVSFSNEKALRYWDGARYQTDSTAIRDGFTARAWSSFESRPNARNTAVFDRRRRAIVWQDTPSYNFSDRQTRELHFTTAPRILRLPPVHSGVAGGGLGLRAIAAGRLPINWRWSRGAPLSDDGHFSGSASAALGIAGLAAADEGNYTLSATNASGQAVGATAVRLNAALQAEGVGGGLWLAWPESAGGLQTSDSLSGVWSNVPDAVPPFYVPALEPRGFFRLVP